MRKLSASFFQSADGIVSDPYLFQFDSFDDDIAESLGGLLARSDDVILGRLGYEQWAGYWPTATEDREFADFINGTPKHVASRTLQQDDLKWAGSSLIKGDLIEHVRKLKASPGGDILTMGSLSVARQLFMAGELDSLQFIVHPVLAASGRRFLESGDAMARMELQEVRGTRKGNLLVTYGRKRQA